MLIGQSAVPTLLGSAIVDFEHHLLRLVSLEAATAAAGQTVIASQAAIATAIAIAIGVVVVEVVIEEVTIAISHYQLELGLDQHYSAAGQGEH